MPVPRNSAASTRPTCCCRRRWPAPRKALETLAAPASLPWAAQTAAAHADYEANLQPSPLDPAVEPLDMALVVQTDAARAQRAGAEDAVLTNGAGNFTGWLHRHYRYPGLQHHGRTQLAPTSGAMGYGLPAAVAAALLQPGRTVVNLAGDGDFLMTGQELATATGYGAKLIAIVVDNGSYGTIRMHQEREYPGRVSGSELFNPDFALLARAYGWASALVAETAAVRAGLSRRAGAPRIDAAAPEAAGRGEHQPRDAGRDPRRQR